MTMWRAPQCRAMATAMMPMGPAPVMSTSSPTTLKASAVCVALPKRIEDGGDFIVDGGRQLEYIARRNGQIFGECARPVHAHARGIAAQVPPPGAAIAAMSAGDVAFSGHAIAGVEAAHFPAQFDDFAGILMADGHGHGHGLLRPGVPVVDMHVGAADGGAMHLDEYIVVADRGFRNVLQPDAGFRACLDQCFHRLASSE